MQADLKHRFARPPEDRPGDVLRWVRRISVVLGPLFLLLAAQLWAVGGSPPWPLLAAAGLIFVSAVTMGPAIKTAERRGPITDPAERARLRRRGTRVAVIVVGTVAVVSAVVLALLEDVGTAVAVLAISAPGFALGAVLSRRWRRA